MAIVKIPFGLKENKLWYVIDVPNGNKCGCICPKCKKPLQARNNPNNKVRPYYAHSQPVDCTYNGMTDIHIMAQQILLDHQYINTPIFESTPRLKLINDKYLYGNKIKIPSFKVEAEDVELEYSWNGFTLDVAFKVGDKDLFIEIAVTHFIEEKKTNAVKNHNLAMIEIDLSGLTYEDIIDKEKFTNTVLNPSELALWINNPQGELRLKNEKENLKGLRDTENLKIKEEREKEQEITKKKKEALIRKTDSLNKKKEKERNKLRPYLVNLEQSKSSDWQDIRENELSKTLSNKTKIQEWQFKFDIAPIVDVSVNKDWIFNTHRANWQSFIVKKILLGSKVTLWKHNDIKRLVVIRYGVIDFMAKLNIVKQKQKKIGKEKNKAYQYYGCWFLNSDENDAIVTPFLPVIKYIEYLDQIGFIKKRDHTFSPLFDNLNDYTKCILEKERKCIEQEEEFQKWRDEQQASIKKKEEEIKMINDAGLEEFRKKLKERIPLLIAADQRIFEESNGTGGQCTCCLMALLNTDTKCPYCNTVDKADYKVTAYDLKTALPRYRSNSKPRDSVINAESLKVDVIKKYLFK